MHQSRVGLRRKKGIEKMALSVIGAGFGRTGTMSLRDALNRLGVGPCYHMSEVFQHPEHIPVWQAATRGEPVDWSELLAGYGSIVDWPGCSFWRPLLEANPDAKILLSWRDAESWHRSVCNTIYHPMTMELPQGAPASFASFQAMARELVIERTFDGKILDPEYAMQVFEQHNASVRRTAPPDRLIEYEVGSGWEPLCEALGVPVPDEEYPRTNTTEEYRERLGLPPA